MTVVLVHGGPGAAGEMAPVAARLSATFDIREPHQTARSVEGQVLELRDAIGGMPAVLVGFSWGAWLSMMVAARFPELVSKLVVISCPTLDAAQVPLLRERRAARLSALEANEYRRLVASGGSLRRLGELAFRADHVDAEPPAGIQLDQDIYEAVWPEAARMRESGELARVVTRVRCRITSIVGADDPSPVADLPNRIVLERCGHTPWLERRAREQFFQVLTAELAAASQPRVDR